LRKSEKRKNKKPTKTQFFFKKNFTKKNELTVNREQIKKVFFFCFFIFSFLFFI